MTRRLSNSWADTGDNLLTDHLIWGTSANNAASVTISGLAAEGMYDIAVYNGCYCPNYTIAGEASRASVSTSVSSCLGVHDDRNDWNLGEHYALLDIVKANNSGEIVLNIFAGDNSNATITDLPIRSAESANVSESTSLALFSLGLTGFCISRRKLKQ
jgi:hypothetical protein